MSYTITGPKAYQTSNNNVIWASQLNASASFLFRIQFLKKQGFPLL
jgi:hypothetical protein